MTSVQVLNTRTVPSEFWMDRLNFTLKLIEIAIDTDLIDI